MNMQYKCPSCQEFKEESEFHRAKHVKRGFSYYCAVCQNAKTKQQREKRKANGPTIIRTSKVCAKCHNLKPVSQFGKSVNTPDGLVNYCKPCWVDITRKAQARAKKRNL